MLMYFLIVEIFLDPSFGIDPMLAVPPGGHDPIIPQDLGLLLKSSV